MPEHDVTVTGYFLRTSTSGKHTVTFYLPSEPVILSRGTYGASSQTYDVYETREFYTGETITVPDAEQRSAQVFTGWNGLSSTMGESDITVYGNYEDEISGDVHIVDEIPVIREKLVNASTGEVRQGNVLETTLGEIQDYDQDGEIIKLRRVYVIIKGSTVATDYYVVAQEEEQTPGTFDKYIKIGDEFYLADVGEKFINVGDEYTGEEEPEEYFILTDKVIYENGIYYEVIQEGDSEKTFLGEQLFVDSISRPVYGKFENGLPTLLTDEKGTFTNWVENVYLRNAHNKTTYSRTLTRDVLDTIHTYISIDGVTSEYEVPADSNLYRYLWYPKGDVYLLPTKQIELCAETIQNEGYNMAGAVLNADVLSLFYVSTPASSSETSGSDMAVCYIMDADTRIGVVTGKLGDAIELPGNHKKNGYTFKGYAEPVPETFTSKMMSVDTVWEKASGEEAQDENVKKYKLSHVVVGHNFEHSVYLSEGDVIPEHPQYNIDGITITGWQLTTEPFEGNRMPAHDVIYSAIFTENVVTTYTLTWKVTYSVSETETVTETVSAYTLEPGSVINPEIAPNKRGATFNGWGEYPSYMPENDLTITGSYTGIVISDFTLNYFVDGELYGSSKYAPGAAIVPLENPVKEGFTFSGWIGLPEKMPSYDLSINGLFYSNVDVDDLVTVTYMLDGELYKKYKMKAGDEMPSEPYPEREGMRFSGWTPVYA